jgi:site-specific recombinase XerD
MRKPFYIKKLDAWFCWINGQQERLTSRGGTEVDAYETFAELSKAPTKIRPSTPVIWLLDEFLESVKVNQAETTYNWYVYFLTSFSRSAKTLTISDLQPFDVLKWANKAYGSASPSTRHGAIRAVQRVFSWAQETGIISVNHLAKIKKPTPNRRETVISTDQWKGIVATEKKAAWRDVFTFMRETGCRVQEVRVLTAEQFDSQFNRFILPANKAKGKKQPRVIYCNETALGIVKPKMAQNPHGPIFRNSRGKILTRNAVRCRFRKYGKGLCATLLRHTYITEALIGGTDCVSVAALCGHDPATLAKVYQHVSQSPQYLGNLAKRIRA